MIILSFITRTLIRTKRFSWCRHIRPGQRLPVNSADWRTANYIYTTPSALTDETALILIEVYKYKETFNGLLGADFLAGCSRWPSRLVWKLRAVIHRLNTRQDPDDK
ncbi:hypothetical protein [Paenibacillus sp. Z6-24]